MTVRLQSSFRSISPILRRELYVYRVLRIDLIGDFRLVVLLVAEKYYSLVSLICYGLMFNKNQQYKFTKYIGIKTYTHKVHSRLAGTYDAVHFHYVLVRRIASWIGSLRTIGIRWM
jgi:hypothetical protein